MEQKRYKTVNEFEEDLKWFDHNCRSNFPQNGGIKKALKGLFKYVKDEIQFIRACDECYENQREYGQSAVSTACSKPHLLLWAKIKGYTFWPGKVLTVNVNEQTIHVQFFGDNARCILPASSCFLYSKNHPEKRNHCRKLFNMAIKVSLNCFLFMFT